MWFIFALSAAILNASSRLSNQYLKLSGHGLTVLIKCLQILFFLPFLFLVQWPDSIGFYIVALLTGPLVLLQDRAFFNFTAEHGAGAIARVEPLSVPLVFVAWLCLHPSELFNLTQTPFIMIGIIGCLSASVAFSYKMRKCDISFAILKAMTPLIIIMALINILAKTGIDEAPSIQGIVVYVVIQSFTLILLSPLMKKKSADNNIQNNDNYKKFALSAFALSVLMTGVIILRLYGFILTPNPAYVTAVMLTAPFWIMLFYKFTGHKEDADIKSGIGIVISAMILSLLVSLT